MKHKSTKTYGNDRGFSCAFRQALADSHCSLVHGYSLGFRFEFEAIELDDKNWVYDFYKQWRDGVLPTHQKFVQAKLQDNPHISEFYEDQLRKLDPASRERLLHGNWEYDDGKDKLFDYEALLNVFKNSDVKTDEKSEQYLTCDVALMGSDKMVITRWKGMVVEEIVTKSISLL